MTLRWALAVAGLMLLAGCGAAPEESGKPRQATPAAGLEAAAIEAGVIADPQSTDITGLYARDTDRVCIVPDATAYRVGVYVDYGDDQYCTGSGTVTRVGESLEVDFPTAPGCSFRARFDGDRIIFPGSMPAGCEKLCLRRASMAALEVDRLSETLSEAVTLRDGKGRRLCASQ